MKFSKEFKIGVFVVTVLTASFFLINYLRGKDIFNKEIVISARYTDVEGLVSSAPVYIRGYKAGKVMEIEYQEEHGNFMVTCSVVKDFDIPDDSRMIIYSMDLLGTKGVKMDLGSSSTMVENGGYLVPGFQGGMVDDLAHQLIPMIVKANNTLDSLSVTVSNVNRLLGDENQSRISNTLAHLEKTVKNVSAISSSIEGRSEDLNAFIINLADLSVRLNAIAQKLDGTVDGMSQVVGGIAEADIKGVVESFYTLLKNINDPDGTIGKLLVDGSVYTSLDTLLFDIDSLVKKIQENPRKYIKISLF